VVPLPPGVLRVGSLRIAAAGAWPEAARMRRPPVACLAVKVPRALVHQPAVDPLRQILAVRSLRVVPALAVLPAVPRTRNPPAGCKAARAPQVLRPLPAHPVGRRQTALQLGTTVHRVELRRRVARPLGPGRPARRVVPRRAREPRQRLAVARVPVVGLRQERAARKAQLRALHRQAVDRRELAATMQAEELPEPRVRQATVPEVALAAAMLARRVPRLGLAPVRPAELQRERVGPEREVAAAPSQLRSSGPRSIAGWTTHCWYLTATFAPPRRA
jgi:hypothetical protein